ncbi:hypothetical protein LC087_16430 [Bacillus carboniphilus]|uniref:Uncharacterized protein n=1 Tax=Bacillus carboniphilus TaxID=86663 RepID=A0ABY9JSB0_9BACI|nr:hypothetical protein [Bacillus carboniphilus]WLR42289.1 hypothetical protein LC087_16430 [Bacillus carboniphilus]
MAYNIVSVGHTADTVEGELLRAIERLRYEAQNNGNGHWDDGFELFCMYI